MEARNQLWLTLMGFGAKVMGVALPLGGSVMIGRDPAANDVVLYHSSVSRTHARIVCRGERFVLQDLGSRVGVKVNGDRLHGEMTLRSRDRIAIGPYLLVATIQPWVHTEEGAVPDTVTMQILTRKDEG